MSSVEFHDLSVQLGLTAQDLAKKLGVTPKTIYNYINGEHKVPLPTMEIMRVWVSKKKK